MSEGRVLRFPASLFPDLVQKNARAGDRLVGLMSDRIREATRLEQQRDRLAALGKLSAGLAHELNNPASAAKRATSQLRDMLKKVRDASHELGRRDLTATQKAEIERLEASLVQMDGPPPDALDHQRSRRSRWIPRCAVTGKMICGNWLPTWHARISSQKSSSNYSPRSMQTRLERRW